MGRQNTVVFGSQIGTTSARRPRTGTLVQQRSVADRVRTNEPATASAASTPAAQPRYGSDPGPLSAHSPASSRLESQWFAPTNPKLSPIGPEIFEARRGWRPPPPSHGVAFAAVSLLLVGVAAAGTFSFVAPDSKVSHATPISTTTITNAEMPSTPAPSPSAQGRSVPAITPADLPSSPPVVDAVKEPGAPGGRRAKDSANDASKKASAATFAPARAAKAIAPSNARATPRPRPKSATGGALPALDRAAAAPEEDDPFSTPGTDTPPAPSGSSAAISGPEPAPSTPAATAQPGSTDDATPREGAPSAAPAPSAVMPDLQIRR